MLDALARFVDRRRRAVLALAVIAVVGGAAFGGPVVGLLDSNDDFEDPSSQSVQAREKLARVVAAVRDPDVAEIGALRGDQPPELLSRDRRSTYVVATFRSDV